MLRSLNSYFLKSSFNLNRKDNFSIIFFDKFKNLLDDYIVNYQIKYIFYILFIGFFYMELSEGLFNLVHNYGPFNYYIFGSFLLDLFSFFFTFNVVDFLYSFFAFQLDTISVFFSLVSGSNLSFSLFFFAILFAVSAASYFSYSHLISLEVYVFLYLLYSFFFFILSFFGILSLVLYTLVTISLILFFFLYSNSNLSKVDYLIIFFILFSCFVSPYLGFLLLLVLLYFLDLQYQEDSVGNNNFDLFLMNISLKKVESLLFYFLFFVVVCLFIGGPISFVNYSLIVFLVIVLSILAIK